MRSRPALACVLLTLVGGCGLESEWNPRRRDVASEAMDAVVDTTASEAAVPDVVAVDAADVPLERPALDVADASPEAGCLAGQTRCGAPCVDVQTDVAHCGACGAVCPARSNAVTTCAAGVCGFTCSAGSADCDGDATNGCERDLRTNPASCGRCDAACASGQGCFAGACATLGRRIGNNGSRGCAIHPGAAGTAWCWGSNSAGALGDGTNTDRLTPVRVIDLTDIVEITVGTVTCARRASGVVACWGNNTNGRLGNGTMLTTPLTRPAAVVGLTGAVEVVSGGSHTCARLVTGAVVCWGSNFYGQLGDGTTPHRATPVAVAGLGDAAAISLGDNHSCARRSTCRVVRYSSGGASRLNG